MKNIVTELHFAFSSLVNNEKNLDHLALAHNYSTQYMNLLDFSVWRIHWRLSTDFKNKQKSVWSNVFWYIKVCIFWKCIQYTIHWDKRRMSKKFPSDKINSTKNALFFLSRAPAHRNFTFNLRFLYELKHKVRLSKTLCGIFHFRFRFIFIKVYIFVQQSAWTLWL